MSMFRLYITVAVSTFKKKWEPQPKRLPGDLKPYNQPMLFITVRRLRNTTGPTNEKKINGPRGMLSLAGRVRASVLFHPHQKFSAHISLADAICSAQAGGCFRVATVAAYRK
jgi:hypothetical protein